MFEVKVVADSISATGNRITTLSMEYPRFIHAEFMTHRVFSRNASSSRAIPIKKMMERVRTNPAMPVWWGKNVAGMQAPEELDADSIVAAKNCWLLTRDLVLNMVEHLDDLGLHKQLSNRLIEPWMHINTIVTSTEFENFDNLRDHSAAQPEMRELCVQMKKARAESTPVLRDDWHLPYVTYDERITLPLLTLVKLSVARCARVSYLNHEGTLDNAKDIALYDDLRNNGHMSPFEHQATPKEGWSGNFRGWHQHRKDIPNERIRPAAK